MASRTAIAACLALACGAVRPARALPPLSLLEAHLAQAPAAQLAEREYLAERDTLAAERAALGASAFGTLGAAHNHDIIDPTHSYTYDQGIGGAGLMLPLLGSRLRVEHTLTAAEERLTGLAARERLTRRELIGRLRKAYAAYWQGARLAQLAARYLAGQSAAAGELALRAQADMTLDAERLDILASFARARHDALAAHAAQLAALALMRDLTGLPLTDPAASRPRLSAACIARIAADRRWQASDPRLRSLRRVVALRAADPRDDALYPLQSNLQLSVQTQDQVTTGQHGASAALIWWVQIPLGYRAERRDLAAASRERLAEARLDYRMRLAELSERRAALLDQLQVLRQARTLAAQQVAAADEAVRERALRASTLGGRSIAGLLQAKAVRYRAGAARLAAEAGLIDWYGEWARFGSAICDAGATSAVPPPTVGATRPAPVVAAARPLGRELYIWRAGRWLEQASSVQPRAQFAALRAAGVTGLRISLDAAQLARAMHDPTQLMEAVRRTHRAGFSVALLLGDPRWILPGHRAQLLRILRRLRAVPFDGLSLDLEPEQLRHPPTPIPELLDALAQTLAAARRASPWPIDLSIQPRDLAMPVDGKPFAAVLQRLRISVTLMVYVANPQRVRAIAAPLLRHDPQLTFRVALSLEKTAPTGQSLRPYPPAERTHRIAQIAAGLAAPNFAGLVFELEDGWRDAHLLAPESPP